MLVSPHKSEIINLMVTTQKSNNFELKATLGTEMDVKLNIDNILQYERGFINKTPCLIFQLCLVITIDLMDRGFPPSH